MRFWGTKFKKGRWLLLSWKLRINGLNKKDDRSNIFDIIDDRSYTLRMQKITQKQTKRENLLNQGVSLLMLQGFHGTGLKEILDAVQIPKGSFYSYFSSKEDFAAASIIHYIATYVDRLQSYLEQSEGNALWPMERYVQETMRELEVIEFKGVIRNG